MGYLIFRSCELLEARKLVFNSLCVGRAGHRNSYRLSLGRSRRNSS
jgi:hypothetical protein